jgi:hypothetical protein
MAGEDRQDPGRRGLTPRGSIRCKKSPGLPGLFYRVSPEANAALSKSEFQRGRDAGMLQV